VATTREQEREGAVADLFAGPGEMRARCRALDWAATPLGPVDGWPQCQRTAVSICLASGFPMLVMWGPELVQLYNDAFRAVLQQKHPAALGQRARDCWPELWEMIGPMYQGVLDTGESVYLENQRFTPVRRGYVEEAFFTFSYSAIPDAWHRPAGILATVFETTPQMQERSAREAELERANQRLQESAVERERMFADVEAARAQVTTTLDSIGDAFYAVDADFRFTYVNRHAESLWGRSREELLGRHYWAEFPGAVGRESFRMHQLAMTERRPLHYETMSPSIGRWIEVSLYPEAGGGLSCYVRDIGTRHAAEAERAELLAEAERAREWFGGVLAQLPVGVVVAEAPSGKVIALNDAIARIWGAPRPQTSSIEQYSTEWVGYHPDGRRVASDEWPIARAVLHGEAVTEWPIEIERADGGRAQIEISAAPVRDPDGRIRAAVAVIADITARVAAERERERLVRALEVERARLAYVFQQAPAFLAVLRGPTHVFELANDAFYQVVGHRELLGRSVAEALPETRGQGFIELLDGVLATGEPFVGRELPIVLARTPGAPLEERFVDFVYQPRIEADGERTGVVAHGTDVTEQVHARREIERLLVESERARRDAEAARAEAEAANQAKGDFLAIMSHELRTPLNAIGGYAELMAMGIRGPVTPEQREDLRRIQSSQRHLLGLINEVLNYAKLETGMVDYDLTDVALREALAGAEALVAPQARAKGLALTVDACSPELLVRADAEKLRQVLVNLLSNAVKFTDGDGRIVMSCVADGTTVRVLVRDSGIGIPADKLTAIFDPFVQVRVDFTRPHEGTGLGLAISRDLARGMGGDLTVESTPGEGSTFTLTLPAA
jgi:PAS domain S-box-containing protein